MRDDNLHILPFLSNFYKVTDRNDCPTGIHYKVTGKNVCPTGIYYEVTDRNPE